VATKQEIAEGLTVDELRSLADEHQVDLSGASNKADIVERVVSAVSKDDLEAYEFGEESAAGSSAPSGDDAIAGSTPLADRQARSTSDQSPDPRFAAGASAADLELSGPQLAPGESIVVKANPETPTPSQVEAAESEQAGPPAVSITVTDADKNEVAPLVAADTEARIAQAVASENPNHPAFTSQGHWSNPNFPVEMTDEEREKDSQEYASRVGG
jgi:hypothetical protein